MHQFVGGMTRTFSRSRFLGLGAAGAVAAAVAPVADAATRIVRLFDGNAHFRRSTYAPHLNSTFRIEGPRSVEARLVEIADGRDAEAFSLILRARVGDLLPGGEYVLKHRAIGSVRLFVSPVGRGAKGQDYQVVVNRATARP